VQKDLRNALERREFRLLLQPIVELDSGDVHGFEGLLRWQQPKQGMVLPREFVPLAEQTGLILPIGTWVLQEACRYARHWRDAFPRAAPVRISVNLSAKQLESPRIAEDVRMALQNAGLEPSCLLLEIPERVFMNNNVEVSTAVLAHLHEIGVELYVDDFGRGDTSLSYLPRFPLQGIKLKRSFVHQLGARPSHEGIVRSIVSLARTLHLRVIAEGVETPVQRERLLALGCELGQGYLFGHPLEPAAADSLLSNH